MMPRKPKTAASLPDQLRAAIEVSEISLYAIAQQSGVSYAQLSRFVSEQRDLTLTSAGKVAAVLGLHLR